MPTIEIRRQVGTGDISYRAKVRVKGYPTVTHTFPRKADAERWAHSTEGAIREGRYSSANAAPPRLVGDVIDRYIAEVLPTKPRNARTQKNQLLWWKQKIGAIALPQLTPSTIATCRDELLERITPRRTPTFPATVVRYLAALSHAFSVAEKDWEWIDRNPVLKVRKPKEPRGRVRFLSKEELNALQQACKASRSPHMHTIFVLAISTGMRRGEILSLRGEHVDLERSRIVLEHTKNGERRAVPLTGLARSLLSQRMDAVADCKALLFAKGASTKPTDITKAWSTAVKKAGIENFRFHDTRHCAASYLLEAGASVPQLAEVLGHKTLQMVKRYSHLSESKSTDLIRAMNEHVFGAAE